MWDVGQSSKRGDENVASGTRSYFFAFLLLSIFYAPSRI
jgi:hypothetical protein